jgi:multidrug resistance efflux pump
MTDMQDEGNYILGFALSFCLGCIGFLVVWFALGKDKPKTKKGAIHGIIAAIVLGVLGVIANVVLTMMAS